MNQIKGGDWRYSNTDFLLFFRAFCQIQIEVKLYKKQFHLSKRFNFSKLLIFPPVVMKQQTTVSDKVKHRIGQLDDIEEVITQASTMLPKPIQQHVCSLHTC